MALVSLLRIVMSSLPAPSPRPPVMLSLNPLLVGVAVSAHMVTLQVPVVLILPPPQENPRQPDPPSRFAAHLALLRSNAGVPKWGRTHMLAEVGRMAAV